MVNNIVMKSSRGDLAHEKSYMYITAIESFEVVEKWSI